LNNFFRHRNTKALQICRGFFFVSIRVNGWITSR
jgi:hypothetical protein